MDSIRCGGCGTHLGDGPDPEPRKPCPACGSTGRAYHEHVVESVRAFDATGFKFSRTVNGKKEWVDQGTSGYQRSRATGRLVRKDSLCFARRRTAGSNASRMRKPARSCTTAITS